MSQAPSIGDHLSSPDIDVKLALNLSMKERDDKVSHLTKENFNLKLRVNHLQELLRHSEQLPEQPRESKYEEKILALSLENTNLKKKLDEQQKLLKRADQAIALLTSSLKDKELELETHYKRHATTIAAESTSNKTTVTTTHCEAQCHETSYKTTPTQPPGNNLVLEEVFHNTTCFKTVRGNSPGDQSNSAYPDQQSSTAEQFFHQDYRKLQTEIDKARSALPALIAQLKQVSWENSQLKQGSQNSVNESVGLGEAATQFYKREVSISESSWKVREFQTDTSLEAHGESSFDHINNQFWNSVITDLIRKGPRYSKKYYSKT